jgi:hypothetical protein
LALLKFSPIVLMVAFPPENDRPGPLQGKQNETSLKVSREHRQIRQPIAATTIKTPPRDPEGQKRT